MATKTSMDEFLEKAEEDIKKVEEREKEEAEKPELKAPELDDLEKEIPEPEPEPEPKKEPKEEPKEDWKVKHDKLYGELSGTIGDLRKEIESLNSKQQSLVDENAELKGKLETLKDTPEKPNPKNNDMLNKLAESFGVDSSEISSLPDLIQSIADSAADRKVQEALKSVGKEIGAVKENVHKSALQVYQDKLTTVYPDSLDIIDDAAFSVWLKDELMFDAVAKATQAYDAPTVLKAIKRYKSTLEPSPVEEDEERKAALEEMAQPGKGRGSKQPEPEKRTYTKSEFDGFIKEYNKGKHGKYGENNPKADALYDKMIQALDEGRVIP